MNALIDFATKAAGIDANGQPLAGTTTDEAAFARLAALSPADYDRARAAEAEGLNIRITTLDEEVVKRRQPRPDTRTPAFRAWPDEIRRCHNDIGFADVFVENFEDCIRFCVEEKTWIAFDDKQGWRRDTAGDVRRLAIQMARGLYRKAAEAAKDMDPDPGKKLVIAASGLGYRNRIEAALALAAVDSRVVVHAHELDADPMLVGCTNGVVDLRTSSFQPHSPAMLVTRRLDANFDPSATAPTWERFIEQVQPDPEMRDFVQRLAGSFLSGEIREHVLPFNYGTGANGKGTYWEHGVLRLAGTYGGKLTNGLVYQSDRGQQPYLEIAGLCGKRVALGEETGEGGRLNEPLLKSMTGADRQKGRFHHEDFFEYFPTYKLALVGNYKPRIIGTDDGIWRRFLLIDWPVQIPEERRDPELKHKIASEMSGVLNWCIAGARAWLANGLKPPAACRVSTAAFREQSDALAEFISEKLISDPGGECTKAAVFEVYRQWANEQGIDHPMTKKALGMQLTNRGWQDFKSSRDRVRCWAGWRINRRPE